MVSSFVNFFASLWGDSSSNLSIVLVTLIFVVGTAKLVVESLQKSSNAPPCVPYLLPFFGSVFDFGKHPINFLHQAYRKYGPVFSCYMFGRKCTYLVGSSTPGVFFNSFNEDFNAEEVYGNLTIPVFGPGVIYDCDHKKFSEQKRLGKLGLTIARFKLYVSQIEEETHSYISRLGDSGEVDIFKILSELVIMTASRCLLGKEVRSMLDERVADLYHDLDGGFTPAAWFLPSWLPLPSFRKRDQARIGMQKLFTEIIQQRRKTNEEHEDMVHTLMTQQYKDGTYLTDQEICGLMIAFLLAGQHTSSATGAWMGIFLAKYKNIQTQCYEEQVRVCGSDLPSLDFETLKDLEFLDRVLLETLRMRPPLLQLMRLVKTPCVINGYNIEKNSYVCVSPSINHMVEEDWKNSQEFYPDRFLDQKQNIEQQNGKFSYIPFGAGRHRCIGEVFANVQIKTIWSTLLRKYEFDLVDGNFPQIDFTTLVQCPKNPLLRYRLRHGQAA
eukprot:Sdes_comp19924_c0_seq1m12357